eukprot:tig00000789_g4133.t1
MSFRELRNLCEALRSLGYPRLVSMENFRTPNFELVADCLYWLLERYDPDLAKSISDEITTEQERVAFVKNITQALASKARLKLNPKKLYGADGYAVKELLKVANMLQAAMRINPDDDDDTSTAFNFSAISAKINEVKAVRVLASDITAAGAELYRLLQNEQDLREARQRAIGRPMELEEIEKGVKDTIASVNESIQDLEAKKRDLEADMESLRKKIDKKQSEVERNQKRLNSLASVRPQFMDEYEKLEQDLQKVYAVYLEKFRNVDYLEHELETYERSEQEKLEESDKRMKRLQKRLKEEELRILRGEQEVDENMIEDGLGDTLGGRSGGNGKHHGKGGKPGVVGSLQGGNDSDDSEGMGSELESEEQVSVNSEEEEMIDDDGNDSDSNF